MPAISKIRFTNVIFENGGKRFNDDTFHFDGNNSAVLLENGGGKTVFVQTALQAILPHYNSEERKIKDTLTLEEGPCHIAIEWILNERPRRYLVTAVSLFITSNRLDSYKYVYEYDFQDKQGIDDIPFAIENRGGKRPASKKEIADYYQSMHSRNMNAKLFKTIKEYQEYIEKNYNIIPSEWRSIGLINSVEGGVEKYFENCHTVEQLVNRLLIPAIEGALAEEGKKDFANIFEKQRERFKKHKQLRERIKESQIIAEKIEGYIKTFENYYKSSLNYSAKCAYAKGVELYIREEKNKLDSDLFRNQKVKEEIKEDISQLKKKDESYKLAILDKEAEALLEEKEKAKRLFIGIKNRYDDSNAKYHSLKIAKGKKKLKELREGIINNQEQLNRLTKELDLEEIREQITENASFLKGIFLKEEEAILNRIKEIEVEREKAINTSRRKDNLLKELAKEKERELSEYNQRAGQVIALKKELKRIEKNILGLDPNKDMGQQLQHWENRIGLLEEENVRKQTLINQYKRVQLSIEENHRLDLIESRKLRQTETVLKEKILLINKEHDDLLIKLKVLNSSWYIYDSLYNRERTIISYLTDKVDIMDREKEEILFIERRAGRYKDDYGERNLFTAEPLVEKWVSAWKDKYIVLETGTQYLQRAVKELGKKEDDFLQIYPYWSLTIVVSDNEIEKLQQRISTLTNQITSPIIIIGQEGAMRLVKSKQPLEKSMILPEHWKDNLNQDLFEKWKTSIEKEVEDLMASRKEKEKLILEYSQQLREVNLFLDKYPYEKFIQLNTGLKEVEENCNKLDIQIKEKEENLIELNAKQEKVMTELNNSRDEINQLNLWVGDIRLYLLKEKEIEEINLYMEALQNKIKSIDKNIRDTNRQLDIINEEKSNLEKEINNFLGRLKEFKKDELYIKVQNSEAKPCQRSKQGLIEERKNLENILYEQENSFKYYEERIEEIEKEKRELIIDIDRARQDSNVLIDETLDYNLYGEEGLNHLWETLCNLKPLMDKEESIYQEKLRLYNEHLTKINIYKEKYLETYNEIIIFKEPLERVKEDLTRTKKRLKQREKENERSYQYISKEIDDISTCIRILEIENARHNYMRENIEATTLEEGFYRDFPYKRQNFINEIKAVLEDSKKIGDNAYEKLKKHKDAFIDFCNENIQDAKLKEWTVSGVKQKSNYQDTIEWRNRMEKSIYHTIRVAEDDMREHDKDLEQFINHLITYLRAITNELGMIPKKTRIRVEDKWKEIFVFNIPEWEDVEAKNEIRKHIDWMINELNGLQFKNEDGTENDVSIRKEVEKWLDIKQLLPLILKNNKIKISCRKVTNDNKISSGLTPWENSNRWSGGEKWSKNMTLFLGILNYIAERRQGIITNAKINRTVIVDNPFGKASSDHVLDPVFYISENLGFQIIALTAHGEGSFIRSYFPVVYSCRLREAINNRTLILDKEREIHYAFFKDKNPDSLYRLEEKEQLSLF